jgi:hypothetical protein
MNAAWNSIKANRKLLLCLAALLALVLCAVPLLRASRTPFEAFLIGTNEVAGAQWVQVVVSNASPRSYMTRPLVEVMIKGKWDTSFLRKALDGESLVRRSRAEWRERLVRSEATLTYQFPLPTERARWRLKLHCVRQPSRRESKVIQWCSKLGFKYPFSRSEHTFEFGK